METKALIIPSKRISYFDQLRGIAIIGVVSIHTINFTFKDVTIDNFDSSDVFLLMWRQFVNFSVPLFLAVSGYFIAKKGNTNSEYISFLNRQIPRVLIPFLIWSTLMGMIQVFKGEKILHEIGKIISFQSIPVYYYIALIIQFYLFLPILKKLANTSGLVFSLLISAILVLVFTYIRLHYFASIPLILSAGNFPIWLIFFVIGLYYGIGGKIKIRNGILLVLAFAGFSFSCLECYYAIHLFGNFDYGVSALKISSLLYSCSIVVFLFNNITSSTQRVFSLLGQYSFGVYLVHMFILSVCYKIFGYILYSDLTILIYFSTVFSCLLVCVGTIWLTRKIVTDNWAQLYLGF